MKRRLLFSVTTLIAISTLSIALSTTAQIKEQSTTDTSPDASAAGSTQPRSTGGSQQSLEDFDIRANLARTLPAQTDELSATSIKLPERRINARASKLLRESPQTQLQISSLTGTASRIYSFQQSLSEPSRSDAEVTARQFIKTNNDLFRLSSGEVDALKVARRYQTSGNRVTHLTLQQQVNGIEVFQGEYAVNIDRNGAIIAAGGELIPEVSKSINLSRPRVSAAGTLRKAARYADAEIKGSLKLRRQAVGAEQRQFFSNEDGANIFARDVESRLVYFPLAADQLRLAWEFVLWKKDTPDVYLMVVDAERGSLLYRHNMTWYCFDEGLDHNLKSAGHAHSTSSHRSKLFSAPAASANFYQTTQAPHGPVYTKDSPRPDVPHVSNNPTVVDREDLPFRPTSFNGATIFNANDPHFDWWAGQPATSLTSNNVDAYLDRNSDNSADQPRLTGADGNFSFPVDLTQAPTTENNQKAAQVNLFYWVNRYHDILYGFGFNEAAGNFQTNNFNLGGLGNDAIRAEAQDGSGTNNANFSMSRDGSPSRVQMYLWTTASPQLDGDFDQGIIIHELTHGLSTRLVGNGTGLAGMQSRGMGEGWSDYFGLVLMRGPNDDLDGTYAVGQYAFNNYPRGIRRFPYSTSSQVYPLNFGDIARSAQVHNVGEIWCNMLLEMRAQLISRHGFQEGQRQSIQLVVDGLKLTPINPTFIDARNAILLADKVNNGGVNQCLLWQAFSKRGMGFSASTVDASDGAPVESFDMPAACSDLGSIRFDRKSYLLGETMKISVGDRNAPGTIRVRVRSSVTNDQETITMTPDPIFIGHFTANLRVVPGRAIPGDGSLQASLQAGDKVVISYDDANTGSGNSTQVTAQVDVVGEATMFEDTVEFGNRGWSAVGKPAPTWGITRARFASPSQAWTDSPVGNYGDFADTSLVSPLFDLSSAGGVVLAFAHSYALETNFDYGSVEYSIDDGVSWKRAVAYTGTSSSFSQVRLTLDALAGQSRVRIRFRLTTDVDTTADGWIVDDIRIIARTSDLRLIPPQGTLAPMITAVSPASGLPNSGTAVTITGANFTENSDTRVFFDNLPVTTANLRVLGASTITAITPAHSAGAVTVRVETKNGASTLANAFTYFVNGSVNSAPELMNIFPVSGSTRGGTQVTIYGSNFTPQTTVTFGNQPASAVTFINSNTLRAIAPAPPAGAVGAVDVNASNPQSTPARLTGAFSYVAPTPPTVSVLSPGGGERLFSGGTVTLRWQSSDNRAVASHQIALYRGSTLVGAIAEVPGAAQSFNWTIPANTTPVTGARIGVLAIDDENAQTEVFFSGEFTIDRRWAS
ncbi:MAG: M36 family metallopeptidase, partial [Blastocatellia bacterium]